MIGGWLLKKLIRRIILIVVILVGLSYFFPDSPLVKFVVNEYKTLLTTILNKLSG